MPGRLSNTDANALLNLRFGATAVTAVSNWYVGLSLTAPNPDNTGVTEPVGGGYARVGPVANTTATWGAVTTNRIRSNIIPFTFPTATANWGQVLYWVLFDAATGGSARVYGELANGGAFVATGETRSIPAGGLVITAPV
jgi:hypothetical protein